MDMFLSFYTCFFMASSQRKEHLWHCGFGTASKVSGEKCYTTSNTSNVLRRLALGLWSTEYQISSSYFGLQLKTAAAGPTNLVI